MTFTSLRRVFNVPIVSKPIFAHPGRALRLFALFSILLFALWREFIAAINLLSKPRKFVGSHFDLNLFFKLFKLKSET